MAGCSSGGASVDEAATSGFLDGWVLDPTLRPVPDAVVRIDGVGAATTDEEGHYRLEAAWFADNLLVLVEAVGFQTASKTIQPGNQAHRFHVNFTMSRLPTQAWTDTQPLNGFVACGAIVQVGHSHGAGSPDEDNHVTCPAAGDGSHMITYRPQANPDDMVIEVFWKASTEMAEFLTLILYDDQGEVVQFDEGNSPLRLEVGSSHVKQRFQDGRSATIELRPGISDGDPPGEIYYSLHMDQDYDVFATTSHGMTLPVGWTVAS